MKWNTLTMVISSLTCRECWNWGQAKDTTVEKNVSAWELVFPGYLHLTVEQKLCLQYALWDYWFFFPLQSKVLSTSRFFSFHCQWEWTVNMQHSDYSVASQGDSSKLKMQTSFYEKIKCILTGCTQISPLSKMCHNDWQGNDSAAHTVFFLQSF